MVTGDHAIEDINWIDLIQMLYLEYWNAENTAAPANAAHVRLHPEWPLFRLAHLFAEILLSDPSISVGEVSVGPTRSVVPASASFLPINRFNFT